MPTTEPLQPSKLETALGHAPPSTVVCPYLVEETYCMATPATPLAVDAQKLMTFYCHAKVQICSDAKYRYREVLILSELPLCKSLVHLQCPDYAYAKRHVRMDELLAKAKTDE